MPRPWHGRPDPILPCSDSVPAESATHKPPPRTRAGAPSSSTPSRRCRCAPAWSSTWPSASTASRTRTRPTCAAPPSLPSSFRGAAQILPGPSPPAAACPRPHVSGARPQVRALSRRHAARQGGGYGRGPDRPRAEGVGRHLVRRAARPLTPHWRSIHLPSNGRATIRRVVASSAVASPLGCCRRWPLTRPSFAPPAPPREPNPPGTTSRTTTTTTRRPRPRRRRAAGRRRGGASRFSSRARAARASSTRRRPRRPRSATSTR